SISDIWRIPRDVWRARRALDRGDLAGARALVGPLLDRFGGVTLVRKVAAEVLYASGDPLSAASLFEQVAKKLPKDRAVVVGLVASYAALNRAGDARRSAALLPDEIDVRLALAWSELVAIGGDRERGARLVDEVAADPELARSRELPARGEHREEVRDRTHRRARVGAADRDDRPPDRGRADDADGSERARAELGEERHPRKEGDAEALDHHLLRGLDVVELDHAFRDHAGLSQERAREVVIARGAIEQDQPVLAELLEAHLSAPGERVRPTRDEHELVVEDRDQQRVGMADRPADPDVDLAP